VGRKRKRGNKWRENVRMRETWMNGVKENCGRITRCAWRDVCVKMEGNMNRWKKG